MKTLGKLKLNDYRTLSPSEMKLILGGGSDTECPNTDVKEKCNGSRCTIGMTTGNYREGTCYLQPKTGGGYYCGCVVSN